MKKGLLLSTLLLFLALGMDSCKKCYVCSQTVHEQVNSVADSALLLQTEVCSGKNGAGANLKVAVADIESTGYTCVQK